MTEVRVAFDGGPMDGVQLTGLFGRVIADNNPPFVCLMCEEAYEHYVKTLDCECGIVPCYAYAGPCNKTLPHPPCGHDHQGDR